MSPNNVSLREIERSISINCAIDKGSGKALQLARWQGLNNRGLGRVIFIYLALQSGHSQEAICDYLDMGDAEYQQTAAIVDEFYTNGRILFETLGHTAGYLETKDAYLFFYRKLVLAQNYLRYRCG